MRASVLSDPNIINTINEFCIAVEINVTKDGFPEEIEALKYWKTAYQTNWRLEFGFANCTILDCEGKIPLGFCGLPQEEDPKQKVKVFLDFIISALERSKQLQYFRGNWQTSRGQFANWMQQIRQNSQQYSQRMHQQASSWWK